MGKKKKLKKGGCFHKEDFHVSLYVSFKQNILCLIEVLSTVIAKGILFMLLFSFYGNEDVLMTPWFSNFKHNFMWNVNRYIYVCIYIYPWYRIIIYAWCTWESYYFWEERKIHSKQIRRNDNVPTCHIFDSYVGLILFHKEFISKHFINRFYKVIWYRFILENLGSRYKQNEEN